MSALPAEVCWPLSRLGEALETLARISSLPTSATGLPPPPPDLVQVGGLALSRWMDGAASWLGLETEFIEVRYSDVEQLIRNTCPALIRIFGSTPVFVLVVRVRGTRVWLQSTDDQATEIEIETLRAAFCSILEKPLLPAIDTALVNANIPPNRRTKARHAMLNGQLRSTVLRGCWRLRHPPQEPLRKLLSYANFDRKIFVLIMARAVEYGLFLLSWWVAGRGVLGGDLEEAWLIAWVLILLSSLPFRIIAGWLAGLLGIELGTVIKQRLIAGSLHLDPDEMKGEGMGHMLGRVLEADALEHSTVGGGLVGLMASVELLMAMFVLLAGPAAWSQGLGLLGWLGLVVLLSIVYLRRRRVWNKIRLNMTHELIEKIVGHRTRLAQEDPDHWYDRDNQQIRRYLVASRRLDTVYTALIAFIPRGWLVVGVATLAPVLMYGKASPAELAIALGGILLAFRAFGGLVTGVSDLLGAWVAWEHVRPLQNVAERSEITTTGALCAIQAPAPTDNELVMQLQSVSFRHSGRKKSALVDCNLEVCHGDRILLEGASGSGKSTLGAVIAGLSLPSQGLLLVHGFDRPTLGLSGWRRYVAVAPQFHENHILSGPLALNVLLGCQWPPAAVEYIRAEKICRELGLGDLIDRMPGGMMQMVGEVGWQLSHGEMSRIYLARAILQDVDLIILDESFAALDSATLRQALNCVLDNAPSLILIAHP